MHGEKRGPSPNRSLEHTALSTHIPASLTNIMNKRKPHIGLIKGRGHMCQSCHHLSAFLHGQHAAAKHILKQTNTYACRCTHLSGASCTCKAVSPSPFAFPSQHPATLRRGKRRLATTLRARTFSQSKVGQKVSISERSNQRSKEREERELCTSNANVLGQN